VETFRKGLTAYGCISVRVPHIAVGNLWLLANLSTDHCLEMLRMNLMCQSDVGLITFEMTDEGIWPDFSTWHTCRKFDNVLDWAMENAVANDDPK
jgi:hypothetical protein